LLLERAAWTSTSAAEVCWSALQCGAVWCSVVQCGTLSVAAPTSTSAAAGEGWCTLPFDVSRCTKNVLGGMCGATTWLDSLEWRGVVRTNPFGGRGVVPFGMTGAPKTGAPFEYSNCFSECCLNHAFKSRCEAELESALSPSDCTNTSNLLFGPL